MSHNVLINGTSRKITGGGTKINGTSYQIKQGKTKIGGTDKTLSFVSYAHVTISGTGNVNDCYATINSNKFYSSASTEVENGSTIIFGIHGFYNGFNGWVKINGVTVYETPSEGRYIYTWEIPNNVSSISISLSYKSSTDPSRITVTTS